MKKDKKKKKLFKAVAEELEEPTEREEPEDLKMPEEPTDSGEPEESEEPDAPDTSAAPAGTEAPEAPAEAGSEASAEALLNNPEESTKREEPAADAKPEETRTEAAPKSRRDLEEEKKILDFLTVDIRNFQDEFPFVDLERLEKDDLFFKFCGSRFGHERTATLYRQYNAFKKYIETACNNYYRYHKQDGWRPPQLKEQPSEEPEGPRLTMAQSERLAVWNKANPHLQMTPEEFLSREYKGLD